MASRKKKNTRSSNTGCLILFAGFIILLIIFVAKFPDIKATLDSTKFLDIVKNRETTTTVRQPEVQLSPDSPVREPGPAPATTLSAPSSTSSSSVPASRDVSPSTSLKTTPVLPTSTTAVGPGDKVAAVQVRQANLFFVKIEDDGVISRREVKRMIPVSDSPLADAVKALIAGPSEGEIRSGLVSLVPRGTKLLGITLRGSTAIIDLSDAFMYNHYGIEGFTAQLKQIVYTATAFPSVQDVQILVEGKAKDYLGGEGVYIGKPLSRNSF
ncbi:MAG TPA: GerMN domain-containing protein [Rectinemataceae bacterium]|nr:GerMN domain-containing protein [Rectinemataceae bacterium]